MKLSISECKAIMTALNRSTVDLQAGWVRDAEGPLSKEEIERRVGFNRRAFLKIKARCEDLEKIRDKKLKTT